MRIITVTDSIVAVNNVTINFLAIKIFLASNYSFDVL